MKKLQIIILSGLSILCSVENITSRDGCAKGWHKNKERVCVKDSRKYITYNQKSDDLEESQSLMTGIVEQSFIDQFNALAAAGITNITNLQIPTISNSILPFITNDQIIQFTTNQIPLFTVDQIPAFQPGQIAVFTQAQMTAMTSPQIQALVPAQVAALPANLLNIALPDLTPDQIPALTLQQIQGLSFGQLGSQIANLAMHQIEYILVPQLQGLVPAAIALISVNQINNMRADQLNALKTILHNSAIITTSNNPNLAIQLSAITTAPGKGFTGDDAPPAKVYRKDDESYIGSSLDKSTGLYQLNRTTGVAKTNAAMSRSIAKTNEGSHKLNRKIRKAFGM